DMNAWVGAKVEFGKVNISMKGWHGDWRHGWSLAQMTNVDLQQRQCLEREATLTELDESRKVLINNLKEYRGTELEVIQETCAFAGGAVEQRDNIVLPPYGGHLPGSFFSSVDESRPLHSAHSVRRRNLSTQQSYVTGDEKQESEHGDYDDRGESSSPVINNGTAKKMASGMGHIIGLTTKVVLVVASVISVFTLARSEPKIRTSGSLKISGLLPKRRIEIPPKQPKVDAAPRCPPGKVLLMEDGIPRCFVRERVEVPFEPIIKVPDVSYGCG
ncbi:hypothetical protein KI387_014365, partial [Taxus chinensis]